MTEERKHKHRIPALPAPRLPPHTSPMVATSTDTLPDAPSRSWRASLQTYLQPKMLAMLLLGFGSGLPFMMFFSKLSRWLSEVGIDKSTIGFFYWIGLAYALKFLWAPVVDRTRIPGLTRMLGQRRSWMMAAVAGTIVGMLLIGGADPSPTVAGSLTPLVIGSFILTYSGATLDISVDAWRIESGANSEQANLAAVYQLGYRFAIMAAGYALILADIASWQVTYAATAAMMGAVGLVILFVREPAPSSRKRSTTLAESFRDTVIDPFTDLFVRLGKWIVPVLALVMLYRLSDFTMGVMTQPLYSDLGYTKTQVGLVQGTFGPWPMIAGAFLGGLLTVRYGMMKTLLLGAVLTIVTNGAFAWLATQQGAVTWKIFVTILADNLAVGIVGTVFIAYMSSLASRRYAATQYALLSSAYAFVNKLIAGLSGALYDGVGAVNFFLLTALYGLPAVALILYIWRYGSPVAKGESKDEPPTEAIAS